MPIKNDSDQDPLKKSNKKEPKRQKKSKKSPDQVKPSDDVPCNKDLAKIFRLMEQDKDIVDYKKTVSHITNRLHEHLSCFIVIGYTQDGSPVHITAASNPKDYDALSTALQKYVFDLVPRRPDF